jgi:two-component system LytT family response regulator
MREGVPERRVRTVIVEDERRARENLREALDEVPWIEVLGEARDGDEALKVIESAAPDLVLLDVHLPRRSGIEVLKALPRAPHVIFTTAYDAFAVTAFELGAVDYLQKPFSRLRLRRALERVEPLLGAPASWPRERLEALSERRVVQRLFVRDGARIASIPVDDIEAIESEGDYARIFAPGRQFLVRSPLREIEARLDPARFVRAHRSRLINIGRMLKLTPHVGGRYTVFLESGRSLTTSREGARILRRFVVS